MAEKFAERTAGIWLPFGFYMAGGIYQLAFWGLFARESYHLLVLGAVSIVVAVSLYLMSRWAFWLGLFTFPFLFIEFVFALNASVNFVGWYPDVPTAAFHASMIAYLVFLALSLILLLDKRNALKSVSIPFLKFPASPARKQEPDKKTAASKE